MNEILYKHIFYLLISYGEELTIEFVGKQVYLDWCKSYNTYENFPDMYISNYTNDIDYYPILFGL